MLCFADNWTRFLIFCLFMSLANFHWYGKCANKEMLNIKSLTLPAKALEQSEFQQVEACKYSMISNLKRRINR